MSYILENVNFTKENINTFCKLLKSNQEQIIDIFSTFAKDNEFPCFVGKEGAYVYLQGNLPVLIVAHMDTVFKNPPKNIYLNKNTRILSSSPDEGIGGDDRCGIFEILSILHHGYRPHIAIFDKEEIGSHGINEMGVVEFIKDYPKKIEGLKYVVELDRKGKKDAVFYSCGNKNFQDYIQEFDFKLAIGSCSDIAVIMPAWNVAGVNLSNGDYLEHTKNEYIKLDEVYGTIEKLKAMMDDDFSMLPEFDHQPIFNSDYDVLFCDIFMKNISNELIAQAIGLRALDCIQGFNNYEDEKIKPLIHQRTGLVAEMEKIKREFLERIYSIDLKIEEIVLPPLL